jgi:hypothetical protein
MSDMVLETEVEKEGLKIKMLLLQADGGIVSNGPNS